MKPVTGSRSNPESGEVSPARVRQIALDLLGRREHSILELRHKLQRRGFAGDQVEVVLEELVAEGLLDEARYAEVYTHSRVDKGYGPLRIHRELRERGVAESIISTSLAELEDHWMTTLDRLYRKRFGDHPAREMGERARQMRFLRHRGFTLEQINQVFRHL